MSQFKSNSVIHVDIKPEAGLVIFSVQGQPDSLRLSLDDIHPDVVRYAALHGLKQRVCDAAALDCDPETGRRPTAEEKYLEMQRIVEHLTSGTDRWRLNGEARPRQSLLLQCLIEQFPSKSREALEEYVKSLDAKAKQALLTSKPLAAIAARLRHEATPPNSKALAAQLLAELGSPQETRK